MNIKLTILIISIVSLASCTIKQLLVESDDNFDKIKSLI